jgi:drug/metabolite transporter (DMT)-like permease
MTNNSSKYLNPLLFLLISLIWGSSFILMKLGLYDSNGTSTLSAYQVAAIRVLSAALIMLPVVFKKFKTFPTELWGYTALSGLLGILFPAFLFCLAETKLDSALTGTLNALVPFFAILIGYLFFKNQINKYQISGILIGFFGILILFLTQKQSSYSDLGYAGFVLLATFFYGINANVVKQKLGGISSLTITAFSLFIVAFPSALILWFSGYFQLPLQQSAYLQSTAAACVLGVIGTAIAWVMFYLLIKRSTALFASSVTFLVPVIALAWGWIYGESITVYELIGLLVILTGVYQMRR